MSVAFLGLGAMGLPMARNILNGGHELTVWNRSEGRAALAAEAGATRAASPREAAAGAGLIGLSLSTPDVVESIVLGDDGLLGGCAAGTIVIDFSTISPSMSRRLSAACLERQVHFLDAPVSGGVEGADAGTLTVMVGGEAEAFARAQPVFDAVGGTVQHVGPSGAGLSIKLINQMLVGVNLAAVLEAYVMAERAGIDLQVMFDVLKTSAGSSVMLTRNVPDFLMRDRYEPGFALKHLVKDLDLVTQMGKEVETSLFTPAVALQLFRNGLAAGLGEKDMSAAIIPMQRMHGRDTNDRGGS
ncbi:MAG: NAD(P)-dependent oxidoreductase [Chloroflexota bacterium]|nr:NAD(P)-dependent oxidoreductase [Chloroflexota bacterium]